MSDCVCWCHGDRDQSADVCYHCSVVVVSRTEWDELQRRLERPPRILPRLRKLLRGTP